MRLVKFFKNDKFILRFYPFKDIYVTVFIFLQFITNIGYF